MPSRQWSYRLENCSVATAMCQLYYLAINSEMKKLRRNLDYAVVYDHIKVVDLFDLFT